MLSSSSCSIYSVYLTIQCPFKTATQKIPQIFVDITPVQYKETLPKEHLLEFSCGQQDAII